MISNRNVDTKLEYKLLSAYSGGGKKEILKSKAKTIEQALDQTVKKVAGGEFLMNAKIYLVKKKYYAVEGDVWGTGSNIAIKGFKIGDSVLWKKSGKFVKCKIIALKDDKSCLVEMEDGNTLEAKYESVTKSE